VRLFRIAIFVLAACSELQSVTGAQSACPSGYVAASAPPGNASGCMPAGSVDCGGGKSCPRGFFCGREGCVDRGSMDCGNYYCPPGTLCTGGGLCGGGLGWKGPVWGNPTGSGVRLRCVTGWACGPDDKCYNQTMTFFCGRAKCIFAARYDRTSECGKCAASIEPPGDCEPKRCDELKEKVDRACKNPAGSACKRGMTCEDLKSNLDQKKACIYNRQFIMRECFRGGDQRHKDEIENIRPTLKTCEDLIKTHVPPCQ